VTRCLHLEMDGDVFMNWFAGLFFSCVRLFLDSVHLPDGQAGVKSILGYEQWLKTDEVWSNGGSDVTRRARTRSKNSEATSTGYGLAGEDFQNTGTFIVLKTSVFALSSEHSSPLARDAYNALWNSQRRGQERKSSPDFRPTSGRCVVF